MTCFKMLSSEVTVTQQQITNRGQDASPKEQLRQRRELRRGWSRAGRYPEGLILGMSLEGREGGTHLGKLQIVGGLGSEACGERTRVQLT